MESLVECLHRIKNSNIDECNRRGWEWYVKLKISPAWVPAKKFFVRIQKNVPLGSLQNNCPTRSKGFLQIVSHKYRILSGPKTCRHHLRKSILEVKIFI